MAERPGQGLLCGLPPPGALTELNGPTEFQLSTHIKANLARPPTHADARCPLGSLAVYDIRVMHRGGAHLGQKQGGSDLCQLARRRLLPPHHASGCPKLRPPSADRSLRAAPAGPCCMWALVPTAGANRSDADRPVVYLTFSRIWYRDMLNP